MSGDADRGFASRVLVPSRHHVSTIVLATLLISCPLLSCPLIPSRGASPAATPARPGTAPLSSPTSTAVARAASPVVRESLLKRPTTFTAAALPTSATPGQAATPTPPRASPTPATTEPNHTPTALPTAPSPTARATAGPVVTPTAQPGAFLAEVLPGGGGRNPLLQMLPALRESPGPAWLQEGFRVTYRVQTASIAQAADEEGSAGAGFIQYDLVALDAGQVVCSMKFYLDIGNGLLIPSLVAPAFGAYGAGDFWVDPESLKDAEGLASDELTVARMSTNIGDSSYNAVRFEYRKEDAEYVWMFDEASGLLLFYRHAIGGEDATHRQLADMTLARQRQLDLPWQGGSLPDWVRDGNRLRYQGAYSVWTMGSPAASLPYSVSVEVKRTATRWSEHQISDRLSGQAGSVTTRVTGLSQLSDAIWLPAEAIDALLRSRTLDHDPVTGAETTVSQGPGETLTLTESGAAYETALTYDTRNGMLVAMAQQTQTGIASIIIELQLTEWQ